MKQSTIIITGGIVAALVAIGTVITFNHPNVSKKMSGGMTMTSSGNQESAAPNTIFIQGFAFGPNKLTIKKGTTITWINKDDAHHDITPTSGASDFMRSKLLAKGESYSFTFNTTGVYGYKCSPHPYMTGTVEVIE